MWLALSEGQKGKFCGKILFHMTTSGLFGRQADKMPNPTSIQAYELFTSRKSLNKHSRFFSLLRDISYVNETALKPEIFGQQTRENSHASKNSCCHISILLSISVVIVNKIPQLPPCMALWFSSQGSFVVTWVGVSLLLRGGKRKWIWFFPAVQYLWPYEEAMGCWIC